MAKKPNLKSEDVITESDSNTIEFILKFFRAKSLNIDKEKNVVIIKGILNNPIESFSFLNKKEVDFIKKSLTVTNLKDLLEYKNKNLYDYISFDNLKSTEKAGIEIKELEEKIQKAINITVIADKLKENSVSLDKEQQKIIIAGLDQAGKTAILTKFGGRFGLNELAKIKPTKKVERREINTDSFTIFLWDFGGQSIYREEYLENPDTYFIGVDLLIYVIDIQDPDRFDESFTYLKGIVNALKNLEENPYILIFLHKYDPDIRQDPKIELNVEFVKDKLKDFFAESTFSHETYLSSIYYSVAREPQFAKYMKEMIANVGNSVDNPTIQKVEGLAKTLEQTLNAVIRLSESMSLELNQLDTRLRALESGAVHMAQQGVPIEISPTVQTKEIGGGNVRVRVLDELKDLFAKRKKLDF
ncbi:MAG: hypothetical protein JXA99_02890 [Candidatus Lokiarchaeota archaeon]|nr:hypothetical protein [Candidatus Lokiarchaeota archaeon]